MVIRRREEIEIVGNREERAEKEKGILTGKMCLGKSGRLVRVYVNKDLEVNLEKLREWMEDGVRVLIGEDFNARTMQRKEWKGRAKRVMERKRGGQRIRR